MYVASPNFVVLAYIFTKDELIYKNIGTRKPVTNRTNFHSTVVS